MGFIILLFSMHSMFNHLELLMFFLYMSQYAFVVCLFVCLFVCVFCNVVYFSFNILLLTEHDCNGYRDR